MITNRGALEFLKDGRIKQYSDLFYYSDVEDCDSIETITKLNDITYAFSEWMEFYYDIKQIIKEGTGENKIVPLITYEMCVSCGL